MRNYAGVLVALTTITVGCGGGSEQTTRADFTVSGSPTGEVDGAVRVVLAFSKPMVAADTVGKVVTTGHNIPVTLSPDFPREAKWSDDKTLVIVATTTLPVSTRYIATVPANAKSLDGALLGKAQSFEFFTERLAGTIEVVGSATRATKDQNVKLTFNQEVVFDAVAKSCGFAAASKTVDVKLAPDSKPGPAKSFTIAAAGDLALDTDWTIACRAGLRGAVGNLGTATPLEAKLHTYGPLRFASMKPAGDDVVPDESLRLEIAFSNPLKPPYKMTLSPTVKGFPERCHELGDPPGISCAGLLDARTSYSLTIDAAQEDVFGQKLGKAETLAFRTTDAQPTISVESGYFVAELKRPVLPVWTRNVTALQVTALALTPSTFHELSPLLDWWEPKPVDFSKTKLRPTTKPMPVAGMKNQWGQHPLDPTQLLGGTPGPGMYYIEIGSNEVARSPYTDGGRQKVLVNFTDIGVVSKVSGSRGIVWATQLSTGKPLPGAQVTVRDDKGKQTFAGTTDADGVVVLPGTGKLAAAASAEEERDGEMRVFVQKDADWTMVNPTRTGGLSTWAFNVDADYARTPTKLRGFMHTDRGLYRPGEKVHVKGIARVTKLGEPLAVPSTAKKVKVEVEGPQGKVVMTTEAKLSAFGGFWFDLDLPADARLGDYVIRGELEHGTFTRTFSVEEYRPATFEVTGKAKEPQIIGRGDVHATINASYLYGAPVRSGTVDVTVHSRPRRVTFPQHAGFMFVDERRYDRYRDNDEESQSLVTEDQVALDGGGNANVTISISPNDIYSDADLLVRANVTSPSNEVIGKTFTVPYFQSKQYFGIKSGAYFLDVKKPAKFQIAAASAGGKLVDAPAKVKVTRRDWNCVWEEWGYRGGYQCKETTVTIMEKQLAVTAGAPSEIEFTPPQGGDYWIVVEGQNDKQEAAAAAVNVYAWGDGGGSWYSSDALKFDIVADKTEYKAGDTATLLLKTDLAEATGLVTIERDGVIEKRLVQVTPTAKHITVPITEAYAPNVYVSVSLVQGRKGDGDRGKPRMRMGIANLSVRPQNNRLTVAVATDKKDYRPGETVTATVKITDASGKPASAEVSITAADEGVLSLIGYETPDPVPTFYSPWGLGVTSATQLEYLRDIPGPNIERPATGGDAAGTIRSRFVSTAIWSPGSVTNASGVATVTFKAPDNLTAFRMMAVAADGGYRFGSADKRFTVSKPLQLHQALPRFLNLGDTLAGGVVVHNETGKDGTATVKLVAEKAVTVTGATEKTVQVPKGGRVPILFDLTATDVGTSGLTFSATLNGETDAVKLELPVMHPSPVRTQDVAASAASKDAVSVPIPLPANAIAGSTELVVSVDPDGLAGIEEGMRELIGYPYGCLEQTTSKVIPMLAVRDLAESLSVDGLTGPKLEEFVRAGLAKIGRHQTPYGGFSLWPGGEPEAYYTAYALWGLHLAKQAGYPIDKQRVEDGLQYLRDDAKNPDTSKPYYDEHGDAGSQAFALYVRAVLGDKAATADATALAADPSLPVFGKAFVARALAVGLGAKDPAVAKLVGELATLAAAAAKTGMLIDESGDGSDYYMSSDIRTTAMVLAALVELDPKNAAIKPLVAVVMKKRRDTRYYDTQENLYTLVALTSYARTVSGSPPSVKIELGGQSILAATLGGKQRVRVVTVPVTAAGELRITPRGEVHYSIGVRYREKPETMKAEASGMSVAYEYLDEAGKPKTSFSVGDVVVVRVTSEVKEHSSHLMLSHRIPAGFEILNTRLATVGTVGAKQKQHWGAYRELRDDRVDLAFEWVSSGKKVNEFSMRAIAVGTFARPPTVGERMYQPDIRGQTAFDIIEVKAK